MIANLLNRALKKVVLHIAGILDKNKAERLILPMSSGVHVKPNKSAQITTRPQLHDFRAERIVISDAHNWMVNDIRIGNVSQFIQSGDIPGSMFSSSSFDNFVRFQTCPAGMELNIVVTYIGNSEQGEAFVCGAIGRAVHNENAVQRYKDKLGHTN